MNSQVNSKWRIAAVILGLVALSQGVQIYRVKSQLRNVFHYDVTVTVKDKETGRILEDVTTHGPSSSTQDLFNQSATYSGSIEKPHISGIAYEPRAFGFSTGGYKRKDVLIANAAERAIIVELEPITSNAEQVGTGQPATRPESKSTGGDKPQPESEGRSR